MVLVAREELLSTCEKTFIHNAIGQQCRLDGRNFNEYRPLQIKYGVEWGSCMVSLGNTKVLAHTSCEIQRPKTSRPHEGILYMNADLTNMGSLYFDTGRQSDLAIQIVRILEKCFKESRCIDLEALCIVSDEKVWKVRVDINVLNYDGNLMGCCSIAVLAALKHFRYPDSTVKDGIVTVHSVHERNPLPLTVRHFPIVLNYVLFRDIDAVIEDPTLVEEKVADTILLLFVNSYDEFCGMHLEGAPISNSSFIIKCTKSGCKTVKLIVDLITKAIENNTKERSSKTFNGLVNSILLNTAFAQSQKRLQIQIPTDTIKQGAGKPSNEKHFNKEISSDKTVTVNDSSGDEDEGSLQKTISGIKQEKPVIKTLAKNTAELITIDSEATGSSDDSDEVEVVDVVDRCTDIPNIELSGDSEEDEVVVLNSELLK